MYRRSKVITQNTRFVKTVGRNYNYNKMLVSLHLYALTVFLVGFWNVCRRKKTNILCTHFGFFFLGIESFIYDANTLIEYLYMLVFGGFSSNNLIGLSEVFGFFSDVT